MRTTHFRWVWVPVQFLVAMQVVLAIFSVADMIQTLKTIYHSRIYPVLSGKFLMNSVNRSSLSNRNKLMLKSRGIRQNLPSMILRQQKKPTLMKKIWMMISRVNWASEHLMSLRCKDNSSRTVWLYKKLWAQRRVKSNNQLQFIELQCLSEPLIC